MKTFVVKNEKGVNVVQGKTTLSLKQVKAHLVGMGDINESYSVEFVK
jgi:hypothetical protein